VPDQESLLEPSARVVRGGSVVLLTYLIMTVLSVVFTLTMFRLLGDEGYGIFAVGFGLFSILQGTATLGIPSASVKYISEYMAKKDAASTKKVLDTSAKYFLITSLVLSVGLILLARPIASGIYGNADLASVFLVVALMLPFGIFMNGLVGFFQGFQRMKYYLYIQTSWSALRLIISVALVLLGFFATGALLGIAVGMLVACAIGFFLLLPRLVPKVSERKAAAGEVSRRLLGTAAPIWLASIAAVVILWYPTLLLGSITTMESAGYYSVPLSLILMMILFSRAIAMPLFPAVSELWTLRDKKRLELTVKTSLKLIFIFILPLAIVMAIFSGFILELVAGGEFIAGSTVLTLLAAALIFICLDQMCGVVLYGIGKPGIRAKIYLGGVLFAVATITPLAYLYGINGAAAGFLVAMALVAVLTTLFAKRLAGIRLGSPAFLRIVLANLVMVALLLGLRPFATSVPHALLVGGAGILVYAAALLLFRAIGKADVQVLRRISKDMGEPGILKRAIRFLDRHSK